MGTPTAHQIRPDGIERARARLNTAIAALAPRRRYRGSEWADEYRYLSPEASALPGKWITDRAPYQREPMDVICDRFTQEVYLWWASQTGKSDVLLNCIASFMDQDPCPMLVALPTVELAEAWSKDRLAPMIRDTPRIRALVRDPKAKDSSNTIRHKKFRGGHITAVGSNAPGELGMRPIRLAAADEIDRFAKSAGSEGDPIGLIGRRLDTFMERKKFIGASTGTVRGQSRIEEAFGETDQRRYFVPCPFCGFEQVLKWNPSDGRGGIVYECDEDGAGLPETARYRCANDDCKQLIEERHKYSMLRRGRWIATNPGPRKVGFHLNALYSPWRSWPEIVAEWLDSEKNPERLRVFVNTVLAETYEEIGQGVGPETLKGRREKIEKVPSGVGCLVASVDVQLDRLEALVVGWGEGHQCWLIEHAPILGDPGHQATWDALDTYLRGPWLHENGRKLYLDCATIDSGGQHTEQVYKFTQARADRRIFAVKGAPGPREIVGRPSRSERYHAKLFIVGVDTAKDVLFSRLRIRVPGAGFIHLPKWADQEFLEQLTAERAVKLWRKGRGYVREWTKIRARNEALDLMVYAIAAYQILGIAMLKAVEERAKKWAEKVEEGAAEEKPSQKPAEPKAQPRRRPGGGWVTRYRG